MMTKIWLPAVCLAFLLPAWAHAESYPNRPVRFIVASGPGSSQDILARVLGNKLTEQLGQQVVVDVRPGAAGMLGTQLARMAAPDGYTIVLASQTPFAALPALRSNLPYDPEKDFLALSRIASVANVLAVHNGLGVGNVAELVKLARAKPAQLNFGSAGYGTSGHLSGALLNMLAGINTTHVPYKGAAQTLSDVVAGQVQFMMSGPLVIMPHAKNGRIRAIATTGPKIDPLLPELRPIADTIPGYEMTQWFGVAMPANAPQAVVRKLHAEIVKALQTSEVRSLLASQGATVQIDTPAEFAAFIKTERVRLVKLGKQANIRLD